MMRFFKSNGFRCVLVLMVVTIVCCGLLAALRTPLYVSSEERTARIIKKIYGEIVDYDDLGVTEEQAENSYGTIDDVFLVGDEYLIKSTGGEGYKNGTITLWTVFSVREKSIAAIKQVVVESNEKQTLMSEIDAEFLAVYVNAGESFLNGDGVFAVTAASGDIQNVTTGATKSSNAADNAVNAALYYLRNFVTGGLD